MPTTITGTDGVSQVQADAVESTDLPAGSVIQVVHVEDKTRTSFSGTTYHEVISANITPQSTSSRIIIQGQVDIGNSGAIPVGLRIQRNSVIIGSDSTFEVDVHSSIGYDTTSTWQSTVLPVSFVDSPNSESEVTYSILAATWGTTLYVNRTEQNLTTFVSGSSRGTTQLILMEVAG